VPRPQSASRSLKDVKRYRPRRLQGRPGLDLEQGGDIVMVKPALPCLDPIYRVKQGVILNRAVRNSEMFECSAD